MKRFFLTIFLFFTIHPQNLTPLILNTDPDQDPFLISLSDLQRPHSGNQPRSIEELILEAMVYLDALEHNMIVDEKALDKYLQTIQRIH